MRSRPSTSTDKPTTKSLVILASAFAMVLFSMPSSFAQTKPRRYNAPEANPEAAKALEQTSQPLTDVNPVPPEYLVFEVPDLPLYGSTHHSWYVLRGSLLWTPTGTVDFRKVIWPRWETKQVPPAITYTGPNDAELVIFDRESKEIARVGLKKGFVPQLYGNADAPPPDHFRIEIAVKPERFRLISKNYEWPKTKELFRCDVEVIEQDFDKASFDTNADTLVGEGSEAKKSPPLEVHPKVKLCLEALEGVAKNASPDKQWYVDVSWPKPQSRRSLMFISENERIFRSALAKNNHVFITRRNEGKRFVASAGHTLIERLESPGLDLQGLSKKEWHGPSPASEVPVSQVADFALPDGGHILVSAFASDKVEKRSLDAPIEFNPPINLQFQKTKEPVAVIRQTEFHEQHTGFAGYLRPWFLSASANFHTLASGRGEELSSLNLPSFELAWLANNRRIEPFLTFEPGVLHYGSNLGLFEAHGGVRWRWRPAISPFVGYFTYALSGANTGAARLGSMDGFSVGLQGFHREEDYLFRGWIAGVSTSPVSYDAYVEASKLIDRDKNDRGLFVGVFAGYTAYRQELQNSTRQIETFSESRFKIGVTAGLAGPEFLTPPTETMGQVKSEATEDGTVPSAEKKWNAAANPLFIVDNLYRLNFVYRVGTNWTVGPDFGYAFGASASTNSVRSTTTNYLLGVRTEWMPKGTLQNGWYLSPTFDIASIKIAATRGSTTGSAQYYTYFAQLFGGYRWFFDDINLTAGAGYAVSGTTSAPITFSDGSTRTLTLPGGGLTYEALIGWTF